MTSSARSSIGSGSALCSVSSQSVSQNRSIFVNSKDTSTFPYSGLLERTRSSSNNARQRSKPLRRSTWGDYLGELLRDLLQYVRATRVEDDQHVHSISSIRRISSDRLRIVNCSEAVGRSNSERTERLLFSCSQLRNASTASSCLSRGLLSGRPVPCLGRTLVRRARPAW